MFNKIKQIPTTQNSHPFAYAQLKCKLNDYGYIEEEYFIYGTANVYDEIEGRAEVIYKDSPYVNRMLIRRPENLKNFSGNIVVEILNPSALYDIDRIWAEAWKYFVKNGDIYIGITAKSDVLNSLYKSDYERYKEISWRNPLPGRTPPEFTMFPINPEYENGIFWDMLTDLALLLRTDSDMNPLAEYGKPYVYLSGWSQCGGFMVRYLKSFAKNASEKLGSPIFDGYYEAGAGSTPAPINSFAKSNYFWDTEKNFKGIIESTEPYIAINTETETPHTLWRGDVDESFAKFRVYEIPASSHDSKYNLIEYYSSDEYLRNIGIDQPYYGLEEYPLDYPYEFVFTAAFRNLFSWVRDGVPAPSSKKIDKYIDGESKKDAFGNSKGGVRTPFIDYPTGRYSKYCTLKDDPTKQRDFWGHVVPFSEAMLTELYSSLDNYRKLITESSDEIISQGYLLKSEREEIIEAAMKFAKDRGLK